MSGDIEADGMVVEPIVQLARALTAVPNGAELHGCCVVIVYAGDDGKTAHALASMDFISTLGAHAVGEMMEMQIGKAREAAALPPWKGS